MQQRALPLIGLLALAGCNQTPAPVTPTSPIPTTQPKAAKSDAIPFTLPTLANGKVSLTEQLATHKAVLLNFWFNECSGCKEEFPLLQDIHREYKNKGFALIAINTDNDAKAITNYLNKNKFSLPIATGKGTRVAEDYKVGLYPTNLLLDKNGKIVFRNTLGLSAPDAKKLRAEIEKLLAAN